jgi:hypothetical protein
MDGWAWASRDEGGGESMMVMGNVWETVNTPHTPTTIKETDDEIT